jgi:hypothetical protein
MAKETLKPGEKVRVSGQYKTPGRKETTLVKGGKAPPTPEEGQVHTLVDKTKHKNDRFFGLGPKKNKRNKRK